MVTDSSMFPSSLEELVDSCISFYKENNGKMSQECVRETRTELAVSVEAFHRACGTLTSLVEDRIKSLKNESSVILMTAHQPNFFPYSGVLRKATLSFVLAKRLEEQLKVPVVSFFGVADQDFTDDRWVKSALLPDAERRSGVLELRYNLPEKLILNKVAKPSKQILNGWRNEIESWFNGKLSSIGYLCKSLGLGVEMKNDGLAKNFEGFWDIVEDAYAKAGTYSDFNAFVLSKIVNDVWGYDTLFCRFSECERVFRREFSLLLSRFDEYSKCVKEVIASQLNLDGGVYEHEHETIPFWFHCDCGSKARLMAEHQGVSLVGRGECLRCRKQYKVELCSEGESKISGILSRISARTLAVPLVFFQGLGVNCYIGGVGGKDYLSQAKYVAEHLNMVFPQIVIWRPRDIYLGVGQIEALMLFRKLSGAFDFSRFSVVEADLRDRIASVQKKIDEIESQKKDLAEGVGREEDEIIERLKSLSAAQDRIRRDADFAMLVRNSKLLENTAAVMHLYPCIVDYAVNVGLKATSDQWVAFLESDGSLTSDMNLRTDFDNAIQAIQHESDEK